MAYIEKPSSRKLSASEAGSLYHALELRSPEGRIEIGRHLLEMDGFDKHDLDLLLPEEIGVYALVGTECK